MEEIISQHPELADTKPSENRKARMNHSQATVTNSAPIISPSIADPCMALEARAVPGTLHQRTHRYNSYARCSRASSESQTFSAFKSQSSGHRKGLPRVLSSNSTAGGAKIPRGIANYFQRARGPQFSGAPLESLRACEDSPFTRVCGSGGGNDTRKVSLGITPNDSQNLRCIRGEDVGYGTDHPEVAQDTETRAEKGRVGSPLRAAAGMMRAPLSCASGGSLRHGGLSSRPIPPRRHVSGLTQWKQGTTGLYPRPLDAAPLHVRPREFPIWNVRHTASVYRKQCFSSLMQ